MRRGVPFGHGPFVTRCIAALAAVGRQNGRCAEWCSTASVPRRSVCRTPSRAALTLAMMAPCPARRDPPTLTCERPSSCRTDRARRYPSTSPTALARSAASWACGGRAPPWRAPRSSGCTRSSIAARIGRHRRHRRFAAEPAQAPRARQRRLRRGDDSPPRRRRRSGRPPQAASAIPATARPARTPSRMSSRSMSRPIRGELMLGHNGNLTNARWLRDELGEQGSTSDPPRTPRSWRS